MKLLYITGLCLLFTAGCSGIKVEKSIKVSPEDWVMSGGNPEQTNVSGYELAPPLFLNWDYNLEGGVGPSGIAVTDAVVFVNALQGELFTFDVSSGGKIGNIKFLGKDASTAPLVLGNDVIVTFAGDKKYSIASYDMRRGEINWRKNKGYIQTSPVSSGGYVFFGGLNGNFYKADISTGNNSWKFSSDAPIHSTCAISNNTAVFGNDNGFIFGINTSDGIKKWEIKTGAPVNAAAMIYEGTAYIGGDDSVYYAIDIETGNVLWKQNLHTKITGGSALYDKKFAVVGCVDGSIYSLNIEDGLINWLYRTRGTIISSPAVSGNYIYCSSYDGYIYALDAVNGKMLWSSMLENKVKTTPVIWKEYLFVAADEILYCFTNKIIESKK